MYAVTDINQASLLKRIHKMMDEIKEKFHINHNVLTNEELQIIVSNCQYEELTKSNSIIFYTGYMDLYRFETSACYEVNDFWYKDTPEVKKTVTTRSHIVPVLTDMEVGFKRHSRTERTVTGKRRSTGQSDVCDHRLDQDKLHVTQSCEIKETVKEHPSYHFEKATAVFLHIYIPNDRLK